MFETAEELSALQMCCCRDISPTAMVMILRSIHGAWIFHHCKAREKQQSLMQLSHCLVTRASSGQSLQILLSKANFVFVEILKAQ